MEPDFLTLDEVLRIHLDQIERYGGQSGLRDLGLLESAVNMPRASFAGRHAHTDLFEQAAAYLFHIVSNHPFIDGNKRTGSAAEKSSNFRAREFPPAQRGLALTFGQSLTRR